MLSHQSERRSSLNQSGENLVRSIEDDPIAQSLPTRASFIPLRQSDLTAKLVEEFGISPSEQVKFRQLCARLQAIFHVEHLTALLHLEELYDALDPDSQLIDLDTMSAAHRDQLASELLDRLTGLLNSAHYKRLTREELERAIEIGWQWGVRLEVDFELFERLEIFARGYQMVIVRRRRWQNFFREETIELPEFQRLIMAFRMKEDNDPKKKTNDRSLNHKFVYLKTFKNIPENDLEILLPGSKVRLTKLDRAKILLPTVSGMAILIYKIARGVLVLSLAFTAYTLDQILGWIVLIGACGGYLVKSVLSYFRTKNRYQFGLTESLYLKNLGNNSSVVYRILNEAEEQELGEAILAYTFLWKHPDVPAEGVTGHELDLLVEEFLLRVTKVDVDFEVHDGLGKLARLGLAQVDSNGRWKVEKISEATGYLSRNWSALFESRARSVVMGEPMEDDLFSGEG
ncbi:MAG: hypothetical protein ACI87E_002677 [Mariniblastus sp.]|jgi:hypothetical protein